MAYVQVKSGLGSTSADKPWWCGDTWISGLFEECRPQTPDSQRADHIRDLQHACRNASDPAKCVREALSKSDALTQAYCREHNAECWGWISASRGNAIDHILAGIWSPDDPLGQDAKNQNQSESGKPLFGSPLDWKPLAIAMGIAVAGGLAVAVVSDVLAGSGRRRRR